MPRNRKPRGPGPPGEPESGRVLEAVVVGLHAHHALVQGPEGRLLCSLRKALFKGPSKLSQPVAVGDRVLVRTFGCESSVVEEILPRRSCFSRPLPEKGVEQVIVANLDQVVVTVALKDPVFQPRFIDHLLVAAEREELQAVVVFNKLDLIGEGRDPVDHVNLYRELGYPVVLTSAVTGQNVSMLGALLSGRTSVFAGPSGVGKSSLLNAIQPGLCLKTRGISRRWRAGRHTTTAVSLLSLEGGGFVVDTPGLRLFGISGLKPWEIGRCFQEIRRLAPACRFSTCSHTHEPECAVKQALAEGRLNAGRFESYLAIIDGEGLLDLEERDDPTAGEE